MYLLALPTPGLTYQRRSRDMYISFQSRLMNAGASPLCKQCPIPLNLPGKKGEKDNNAPPRPRSLALEPDQIPSQGQPAKHLDKRGLQHQLRLQKKIVRRSDSGWIRDDGSDSQYTTVRYLYIMAGTAQPHSGRQTCDTCPDDYDFKRLCRTVARCRVLEG